MTRYQPPSDEDRKPHQNPRNDAGKEQFGDGNLCRYAKDDEWNTRRNNRRDDPAASDQAGTTRHVVFGVAHHWQQQRGKRGRVRQCRTGKAGHDDRGNHGHVAQTALDMPNQAQRHVDDAAGEPAGIHELPGQHEEWCGQQNEVIGSVDQVLGDQLRVEDPQVPHHGRPGQKKRKSDGHAECHEPHQAAQKNQHGHF